MVEPRAGHAFLEAFEIQGTLRDTQKCEKSKDLGTEAALFTHPSTLHCPQPLTRSTDPLLFPSIESARDGP